MLKYLLHPVLGVSDSGEWRMKCIIGIFIDIDKLVADATLLDYTFLCAQQEEVTTECNSVAPLCN